MLSLLQALMMARTLISAVAVTGIDDGEDVDRALLTGIYERVRACEFQPSADHVLQVVKVEQMILGKKPVCSSPLALVLCLQINSHDSVVG